MVPTLLIMDTWLLEFSVEVVITFIVLTLLRR